MSPYSKLDVGAVEFVQRSQEFPILCFPAFEMQDTLRGRLFGAGKWHEIADKRSRKYGRQTIFQIMDGISKSLYSFEQSLLRFYFAAQV